MTESWFRQAFLVADQSLDTVFAETFTIRPMTRPANGRPIADSTRVVSTIQGIYDAPSTQAFLESRGHAAAASHQFATSKPLLEFTTASLPYAVAIDDIIVRNATGEIFTVADPGFDGVDRSVLKLTGKS